MTSPEQQQTAPRFAWSTPQLQVALIAEITTNNFNTAADNQCTGSRGRFEECRR